ncbi:MAG: sulfite exporter TauE/SafE family protein [Ignavibacteriales bacterium]|nr:sulfite exporter TauE/SafE family protein [Ignavibacteriales bacterium]MBK7978511.1 sulfite exporter TauE/SafE family protein [Ignavibacteriota bacterium]
MNTFFELILLFTAGVITSFINVMAGGGSTLTLPILIFLGLDAPVANGTNRLGILSQSIFGALSFHNQKISQIKLSIKLSLLTLPGAIIGAFYSTKIENELFEKILGVVMIGIVITMLIPNSKKVLNDKIYEKLPWLIYPSMLALGFYGGFIQVGIGFLLMLTLHNILKLNLVYVNFHKVFIVLIYTIPAFLIFVFTNNVNWLYGISLSAGSGLGAWWAAKVAVRRGEKVIKIILIVSIIIMAYQLLIGF